MSRSGGEAPSFLTSALDEGNESASSPFRLTPGKEPPVPTGLGGQKSPSGLKQNFVPYLKSNFCPSASNLSLLSYPRSGIQGILQTTELPVVYKLWSEGHCRSGRRREEFIVIVDSADWQGFGLNTQFRDVRHFVLLYINALG
jgi:hypothetical protein